MLFMDHRGSLFHEDLAAFEELGLFKEGAYVVADNVLKPGAPYFLWRVCRSGHYDTQLTAVPEFGLGHQALTDWMAICRRVSLGPTRPPEPPEELQRLAQKCDDLRRRSLGGRLDAEDWSTHSAEMEAGLATLGIAATLPEAPQNDKRARPKLVAGNPLVAGRPRHSLSAKRSRQAIKKEKRKAREQKLEDWQMRH
ncbi:unnamed protein product [Effrenium voratum]|uniref:Uncharacterized protein n=1 Tax=Effrenium voratum TaxID=2562239 RepID=A0AA36HKE1_9DINO|nr:unnamed protein product [Effrenium voratum]